MIKFLKPFILGIIFLIMLPAMTLASDIKLNLTPLKKTYVLGEPITIHLTLKNISSQVLELMLAYPKDLGLTFTCEDKDAISHQKNLHIDRRIPIIKLLPNKEYKVIFALNRYFDFKMPKQFRIKYLAEYLEPVSTKNPNPKMYSFTGEFLIEIKPGFLNKKEISQLQQDLEETDKQKIREAIELLLWVDDSSVIDSLEKAVKILPEVGVDVLKALRKFITLDRGKSAILKVAALGNLDTLKAALNLLNDLDIFIPDNFYHQILMSKDTGKQFATLEHLLKYGNARYLPLIRPMRYDNNPNISKLAEDFVKKFE